MILHRDQESATSAVLSDTRLVHGLRKPGIDHRYGEALLLQQRSQLASLWQHGAQSEHCYVVAVLDYLSNADLQRLRLLFHRSTGPSASRVADRARPRMQHRRIHHVRQLVLVLRNHVDNVRNPTQIADVEQTMVRRSVIATEPAAVHAEDDRQLL